MKPKYHFILLVLCASLSAFAQTIPTTAYQELSYRMIGPFRAGRTVGATGVPSQPNVFYMGVNNGGVWKTDDFGRTWKSLFDKESTNSIGDVAVSLSNPNIVYVGTGEGLHRPDLSIGDGVFKSMDGGATWKNIGLREVQQIGRVAIHPTNPDIVFVAALGHPYGANDERGVYRTTNGGQSWEKVFFINHNTGAMQIEFDPQNPNALIVDMWEHQDGPWENSSFAGTHSGLFKSTDGGSTWNPINNGFPTQGLGRIGFAISPSNSKRMYALVDARENGGVYRSDDGGENWKRIQQDPRIWGRGGDFAEIKVHPQKPDEIYVANVACYRSNDAGMNWTCIKGAPGGDDYHRIWINPTNPQIMLFVADQGATVTVNAGKTWGSWLNQPTAQLYHVSTDNQFPYWVYGGQQESGAIGTASRGPGGQISFRDWMGVGADEYAYVVADPKNSDIIYGGKVTRFNKKTGQTQNVAPEALRSGKYRALRTMPLLFHPADPNMLLFATNVLWKSMDGANQWEIISPDLTRAQAEVPESIGDFRTEELKSMKPRGVIYSVAASPLDKNIIWAGTDDGLVQMTNDGGKTWKNVTPSSISSWDKISQIDAGHFDANTAYISVNSFRKDDLKTKLYKTHDGGATWKEIVKGLEQAWPANVIREDVKQKGLLFCGTERTIYFSVDDGESWQSLRQNMPITSIRDLVIHEDDIVVGTHGRSIWILDNIVPLRNLASSSLSKAHLFTTALATRVRNNMFGDTPMPPEEPAGQNPPDGTAIDYFLPSSATNVSLEIFDAEGNKVNAFTNHDKPEKIDSMNYQHPLFWIKPSQILSAVPGHHRFIWDLRYEKPRGTERQLSIWANNKTTPLGPLGPYVAPGNYKIKLTADGVSQETSLTVRMDPRVTTSSSDVSVQSRNSLSLYQSYLKLQAVREDIDKMVVDAKSKLSKEKKDKLLALRGNGTVDNADIIYGAAYDAPTETIISVQNKLIHVLAVLQSSDEKPTQSTIQAVAKLESKSQELLKQFELINKK
jgi:photosystem II stability/assembly factor-like uncharacterized protein